jgi:hypothetical protein
MFTRKPKLEALDYFHSNTKMFPVFRLQTMDQTKFFVRSHKVFHAKLEPKYNEGRHSQSIRAGLHAIEQNKNFVQYRGDENSIFSSFSPCGIQEPYDKWFV